MKIETTHLHRNKLSDRRYRWYQEHDDKCNAAKSNKNLISLTRCDCHVFFNRIDVWWWRIIKMII